MSSEKEDSQPFSPVIVSGLLKGLTDHKQTSEFCDVQIVIDNCEFPCHRLILAAYSGFFKAVFTSGMKEDIERKVVLQEISRETFADILSCIYAGRNVINDSNMFEIWHAADMLQILSLLQECEVFVKNKINTESCLAIYQHSKLLASKELIALSWSYIVNNFESVRRIEGFMMLTDEEMEKLIASPDLKTHSEDHVLETIIAWIAYKPTEFFDERCELVHKGNYDTREQRIEGTLLEDCQHQDVSAVKDDQMNNYEPQIKTTSRADHLINLLKLTRVCLLSGKCLIETMGKDSVRTNKAAQEILQTGLEYKLRTDRRHDFCPNSAIHRSVSHLENVVVAAAANNMWDVLVCRSQDGKWYGLGNRIQRDYSLPSITCFNNDVYLAGENNIMQVYETSKNTWTEIKKFATTETVTCVISIGNLLYAVRRKSECYSVEVFNVINRQEWIQLCPLSSELSNISCSTVMGNKVIFFGSSTGKSGTQVVIFDTATLQCFPLNNTPSLSSAKVCFSNCQDSFVLQKDGTLYRIRACPDAPFIEIVYETMLWDFDRDIKGAVLFNDELWLFGPSFSTSDTDKHWELSIPGVFKCVKNIICSEAYSCFMHTVIPKEYLSTCIM